MRDEIRKLAGLGLRLHPLVANNKIPILRNWPTRATSEISTLETWEDANAGCNWGVATGAGSGIIVIDVDPKNGGDKTWQDLVHQNGDIKTPTCKTGSGGLHIYLESPKTVHVGNSTNKVGIGIDVRGENGQVVVPPSIHPNGTEYVWVEGMEPWTIKFARVPAWLMKRIRGKGDTSDFAAIGEDFERGIRNNSIFHQAKLLAHQDADKTVVFQTMRTWCDSTGNGDISDEEIQKTIDSAYQSVAQSRSGKIAPLQNDMDNATRLVSEHGEQIAHVSGLGWYVWNRKYWAPDSDSATLMMLAADVMRKYKDAALEEVQLVGDNPLAVKAAWAKVKWAINCMNKSKLSSMVDLSSFMPRVRYDVTQIDPPNTNYLLNCQNGVVDLKTGEMRAHAKTDMLTKIIPYNYSPKAKCPEWEHTLQLAFDGNEELIIFMQRALGYTLTGSNSEQCMFICWGPDGNNGKSTILETVQRLMGRGYAKMVDVRVVTTADRDNNIFAALAELPGIRMVSMNEAEEGQRLSESLVKQITGGDTIQACKKYMSPFEFIPVFKVWLRTNEKPNVRGSSDAIWRRIKLIPFNKPIPADKRKPRDAIDAILEKESEGILAWLIRGAVEWSKDGLREPEIISEATKVYRTESDLIALFVDECVITNSESSVDRQIVYKAYTAWMREQGYRNPLTAIGFNMRMAKILGQHERTRVNRKVVWTNTALTDQAEIYAGHVGW